MATRMTRRNETMPMNDEIPADGGAAARRRPNQSEDALPMRRQRRRGIEADHRLNPDSPAAYGRSRQFRPRRPESCPVRRPCVDAPTIATALSPPFRRGRRLNSTGCVLNPAGFAAVREFPSSGTLASLRNAALHCGCLCGKRNPAESGRVRRLSEVSHGGT